MSTKNSGNAQNKPKKDIQSLTVYLPGYLRLKFKNFVSLDLPNLSGQMNATLIYSIYYGGLFEQLRQAYGISEKDEKMIRKKMESEFVMNFSKDDAIQLTEGKKEKLKRYENEAKRINQNKKWEKQISRDKKSQKEKQQLKLKRNIEMTVKAEQKQRMIKFTLRKNFLVHLKSSVFWTPFEIIDSILEITLQSLKVKTQKFSLNIEINLMDTKSGPSKISYSEQKKFGQYGIVLSGLEAIYSSKKLIVGNPEVFDEKAIQGEDKTRLFEKKLNEQGIKRFKKQYQMVMGDEKYKYQRIWYQNEYNKNKAKYKYFVTHGFMDDGEDTAALILKRHGRPTMEQAVNQDTFNNTGDLGHKAQNSTSKFVDPDKEAIQKTKKASQKKGTDKDDKLQACKYACFKVPLYKLPFTSMATIFVPLWLLAVLNLGVFFQDDNLADRIASIASLALAFIAFIPTIREQIPPSPSIVFVEILVYLVAATSLLALGQSIQVHQIDDFVFEQWQDDPWFMISMILNIVVCAIVMILMSVHYCVWQPRYKKKVETGAKEGKLDRKYWYNRPCEKEFRENFKSKLVNWTDWKEKGKDKKKEQGQNNEVCHRVFEVIDEYVKKPAQNWQMAVDMQKIQERGGNSDVK